MKKSIFALLSIVLLGLSTSCKKTTTTPVTNTVTVTKTDTVTKTVTVYDTIHVIAMDLVGIWKVYKVETVTSGNSTFSNEPWIFDFNSSNLLEDLTGGGNYTYTYPVVYGAAHIDITYSSTVTQTYSVSVVGNECRLTTIQSNNQTQVLYLKK
ncbi:MAG TPA: hypothetical protein VN698_07120 [Bacteroidia bacterium]|nr:hypothetical protein [Bacteroidia bacterium]